MKRRIDSRQPLLDLPPELSILVYEFLDVGVDQESTDTAKCLVEHDCIIERGEAFENLVFKTWFGNVGNRREWKSSDMMKVMFDVIKRVGMVNAINGKKRVFDYLDSMIINGSSKLALRVMDTFPKLAGDPHLERFFYNACKQGFTNVCDRILSLMGPPGTTSRWSFTMLGNDISYDLGGHVAEHGQWPLLDHPRMQDPMQMVFAIRRLGARRPEYKLCEIEPHLDLMLSRIDKKANANQLGKMLAELCCVSPTLFMAVASRGIWIEKSKYLEWIMENNLPDPWCVFHIDRSFPKEYGRFTHPLLAMGIPNKSVKTMSFETFCALIEHDWAGKYYVHPTTSTNVRATVIFSTGHFYSAIMDNGIKLSKFGLKFMKKYGIDYLEYAGSIYKSHPDKCSPFVRQMIKAMAP